jgi:deoxyribonuclease II
MLSPLANASGTPVDWWFMYKLPMEVGPNKNTSGYEYLYLDANSDSELALSPIDFTHENSAFGLSLKNVFDQDSPYGYILWNDEIPPTPEMPIPRNIGKKGHSKGILAFSKSENSGFYLIHSTPRFPSAAELELPEIERKFGQTLLCVSLKDYQTANDLAQLLHTQNDAQVYDSRLIGVELTEELSKFAKNEAYSIPASPANFDFETKGGQKFKFIAKNRNWSKPQMGETIGKDFWKDLVVPSLNTEIDVETWRRGNVFGDGSALSHNLTEDVVDIDLSKIGLVGYQWSFAKDHAKWGVSFNSTYHYVIIADINRQVSQERRGGGGLAFESKKLWQSLTDIEIIERNINSDPHHDTPN